VSETIVRLDQPVEFLVFGEPTYGIYIRKCFGDRLPKEPTWKVTHCGQVFAKDGELDLEPSPSSRDDEFYALYRFDTYDEAHRVAERLAAQPRVADFLRRTEEQRQWEARQA
jgi:hypothetical protein